MLRAYPFFLILCAGLLFALYAQKQTYAQSIEDAMAKSEPESIEIIAMPDATINCFKIKEGFLRGKWVTEHRICQYKNDKSRAWVESHWTCYSYDKAGVCMSWVNWSTGWYKTTYITKSNAKTHHSYSSYYQSSMSPYLCE